MFTRVREEIIVKEGQLVTNNKVNIHFFPCLEYSCCIIVEFVSFGKWLIIIKYYIKIV